MIKISIDARFYGIRHTGLGRYTTNVLKYLPKYLPDCTLQVLLRADQFVDFKASKNVQKIRAEIPHYSFAEQIQLPLLLKQLKSDLFYAFHFNTPLLSGIPTIVTVHDLIKTHSTGMSTTTHTPLLYAIKRIGYNLAITHALTKSCDIIVPTNTVKNDILASFPTIRPELIHPIPEAPDEIFRKSLELKSLNLDLPKKYLLFVGNAYPHKNLSTLLTAYGLLRDPTLSLVIVAKRTPFLSRTLAPYDPSRIQVLSELTDAELVAVYRSASALVTPSLMEGYGLVGLEALMVGTPVIASNIPVYREVYRNLVTYFDPTSSTDLARSIKLVLKSPKPHPLHFERTWDNVAESIAEVIHARCISL